MLKIPTEHNITLLAHFSWGINTIYHYYFHLACLSYHNQRFMGKWKHSIWSLFSIALRSDTILLQGPKMHFYHTLERHPFDLLYIFLCQDQRNFSLFALTWHGVICYNNNIKLISRVFYTAMLKTLHVQANIWGLKPKL